MVRVFDPPPAEGFPGTNPKVCSLPVGILEQILEPNPICIEKSSLCRFASLWPLLNSQVMSNKQNVRKEMGGRGGGGGGGERSVVGG